MYKNKNKEPESLSNNETVKTFIDLETNIKLEGYTKDDVVKISDDLFVNVSHEFKTPINIIYGAAQLMETYLKNSQINPKHVKASEYINAIKQSCFRLTKIVNNIIDLTKIQSGEFILNLSNENIVEVVEDMVQNIYRAVNLKDIKIVFDTDTEEKIISCDVEKIERVLLNLISNAVKFSKSSGTILVSVSDKSESVEISVKDNGIGIDEKYLDKIFYRFGQIDKSLARNSEGYGIGLCLAKSIIELHDGSIGVESGLEEGSNFKFEIPVGAIKCYSAKEKVFNYNNKIEMINIEFSDVVNNLNENQ